VTVLLEKNPFPDAPPQYIRAQFYAYTFTGGQDKSKGVWWQRRLLGLYFPEAQLKAK
jgi:lipase maturation factor 1